MKKNYTIPILIYSIVAMIIMLLLLFFIFKVIENKNQHASVVFKTLETKIKEKDNAITNASKITELKSIQDSINSHFVDPNKIDIFVGYLEEIGSKIGSVVSVEDIKSTGKNKNMISTKLSIKGTFSKVMKTIALLENIPYQINITQIYLNKSNNQGIQGVSKEKIKISNTSTWQADVSFNILSLN